MCSSDLSEKEEEKRLFEEPTSLPLTHEQQDKIAVKFLEHQKEEYPDDTDQELEWSLIFCQGVNTDYLKESILDNKYSGIQFPGENGKEIFNNNIDFLLSYFRRD